MNRRAFTFGSAGALTALGMNRARRDADALGPNHAPEPLAGVLASLGDAAAADALADDEAFWARVRRGYALHPTVLNLDNGWTNPAPRAAIEQIVKGVRTLEALPAEELERMWFEVGTVATRAALAEAMGVPGTEIAIVRNATEALDTVLLGIPLAAGDEVVCSTHDYYAMLDALEQRRARDNVVLRMVHPQLPAPSLEAIAAMYEAAIGPRTRLVLLTNPSNLTGQLLPTQRIAAMAHRVGAEVVIDGAQSLGLLEEPVSALGCDYYGASAHKWLGTPVGTGVLWMKPEHAAKIWPLIPPGPSATGMGRFEWIGTGPAYIEPAAIPALRLHQSLGAARKAARLRYLATHLRTALSRALPSARYLTLPLPEMSVGITTVQLPWVDADALQKHLRSTHNILVQSMGGNARAPEISGIRVTPNVYHAPAELDRLVAATQAFIRR